MGNTASTSSAAAAADASDDEGVEPDAYNDVEVYSSSSSSSSSSTSTSSSSSSSRYDSNSEYDDDSGSSPSSSLLSRLDGLGNNEGDEGKRIDDGAIFGVDSNDIGGGGRVPEMAAVEEEEEEGDAEEKTTGAEEERRRRRRRRRVDDVARTERSGDEAEDKKKDVTVFVDFDGDDVDAAPDEAGVAAATATMATAKATSMLTAPRNDAPAIPPSNSTNGPVDATTSPLSLFPFRVDASSAAQLKSVLVSLSPITRADVVESDRVARAEKRQRRRRYGRRERNGAGTFSGFESSCSRVTTAGAKDEKKKKETQKDEDKDENEDESADESSFDILEEHVDAAVLILSLSEEVNALRFRLVPARMSEGRFWAAVFRLILKGRAVDDDDDRGGGGDGAKSDANANTVASSTCGTSVARSDMDAADKGTKQTSSGGEKHLAQCDDSSKARPVMQSSREVLRINEKMTEKGVRKVSRSDVDKEEGWVCQRENGSEQTRYGREIDHRRDGRRRDLDEMERLRRELEKAKARIEELEKSEEERKSFFATPMPSSSTTTMAAAEKITSEPSLDHSRSTSPRAPTPHCGKWEMDRDCADFLALDDELRANLRREKAKRLEEVQNQMSFILDGDDVAFTSGKWTCCGRTEYLGGDGCGAAR